MYKILLLALLVSFSACRSKKKNDVRQAEKVKTDSVGKSFKSRLTDSTAKNQNIKMWRIEWEYVTNPVTGKSEPRKKSESGASMESNEAGKKQLDTEGSESSLKKAEDKYYRITETQYKTNPLDWWLMGGAFVLGLIIRFSVKSVWP